MTPGARIATDPAETTLDRAHRGDEMVVMSVDDDRARVTAIRFGIAQGAKITCVTRIPAGPIVLKSGRQEIAVGRNLAKRICVRPCPAETVLSSDAIAGLDATLPCEGC